MYWEWLYWQSEITFGNEYSLYFKMIIERLNYNNVVVNL